jgi:formylglycine-generating enzyme
MRPVRAVLLAALAALALDAGAGSGQGRGAVPSATVRIEAGTYRPLYTQPGEDAVRVDAFLLHAWPVSRSEFEAFVGRNPKWRRGAAAPVFVDGGYLRDWPSPVSAGDAVPRQGPVTNVSWFAARAYCAEQGGRLPTTAEWEYVALADEQRRNATEADGFLRRTLEMAMQPRARGTDAAFRNVWGVHAMHGGVMEWVSDFQGVFAGSDSRVGERREQQLTCAGGATATGDARDYAAFLRYAYRGSVQARTTTGVLGFRCARGIQ